MLMTGKPEGGTKVTIRQGLQRLKHYGAVAVGGMGLTGGRAVAGPLNAQIGISDPCNHKCVMCWDHPPDDRRSPSTSTAVRFGQARPRIMSLDVFQKSIDDLRSLGTRRVEIVGRGEPMMNPAATAMVQYAKSCGMEVQLISNGSLLSSERADELVAAGLDNLKISLNAGTAQVYPKIHVTESADNYENVKRNLRYVARSKKDAGVAFPHVTLSFVISAHNYFELEEMVRAGIELSATEIVFTHAILHEKTQDLALSEAQLRRMRESVPLAVELASENGLQNNLAAFGASVPLYMDRQLVGPATVPCYAGWYFTFIMGNGSVMFCCQCSKPVERISEKKGFADIWRSREYKEFRQAARALPAPSETLMTCECDNCALRARNVAIHNFLNPMDTIECGDEVRHYRLGDLIRKWRGDYV